MGDDDYVDEVILGIWWVTTYFVVLEFPRFECAFFLMYVTVSAHIGSKTNALSFELIVRRGTMMGKISACILLVIHPLLLGI